MDLDAFYNGRLPLLSQFTGGAKVSFTPSYFDLSSARWVPLCRPWGTRIEVLRQRRHTPQQTPSFASSLSPSFPHSQPLLDAGSGGESKRGEWGAGSGGGILEEEESIKVKVEADEPLLITLTDIVLHHVTPGLQAWVTAATTTAGEARGMYDPQHASSGTEEGGERAMQPPSVVSSLEPVEKVEAPIVFCNELGVGATVWRHLPHRYDGMHAGRHGEGRGNVRTQSDGSSGGGRGGRGSADGTHPAGLPAGPPTAPPAVSWVPGYGILPVSFKDQHLLQSSNGSSDGPTGTRERDALSGFRVRRVYGQDADDAPNVLAVLVEGAMEVRWGDESSVERDYKLRPNLECGK